MFETGGKQYRAQVGDRVSVEKLIGEKGTAITFEKVLLVEQDGQLSIGTPYVAKAQVVAAIEHQRKLARVRTFKMKAKKNIRKRRGDRQMVTDIRIQKIEVGNATRA